jgi:hypothetical protein
VEKRHAQSAEEAHRVQKRHTGYRRGTQSAEEAHTEWRRGTYTFILVNMCSFILISGPVIRVRLCPHEKVIGYWRFHPFHKIYQTFCLWDLGRLSR